MSIDRGFCRNREQELAIKAHGLPPRDIFMDGQGAESLEHCIASFRGRPGTLVIAHDLRLFGGTKRQVKEVMAQLETLGIKVTDLTHPEDTTVSELIHRANVLISGSRFIGDRPRARRQGRAGGLRKGVAAQSARDEVAPRWLVDRLVDDRRIPWDQKLQLLEPHFTEATLRRHYGIFATKKP